MKKLFLILLLVSSFVALFVFLEFNHQPKIQQQASGNKTYQQAPEITQEQNIPQKNTKENQQSKEAHLNVPFIVQAPFANWKDPVFQNACEEASIAMAVAWERGVVSISDQDAKIQILDIVEFENKTFGYNADTNVFDVQKIFENKFNLKVAVMKNTSLQDIIGETQRGNLILVPAFGQKLGNPYFTSPGPIAHMLVITGYDSVGHKFVTNDPGTKHGKNFSYDENVLYDAIWDYPSGPGPLKPPSTGDMQKTILIVSKF